MEINSQILSLSGRFLHRDHGLIVTGTSRGDVKGMDIW